MNENDKQRVRDAFQKAIDRDPVAADLPIEGWHGAEGTPKTSRELIQMALTGAEIYNRIEIAVNNGKKTLDDYLRDFEKSRFPVASKSRHNTGWRP